MSKEAAIHSSRRNRGVALIIVLAFLVLLVGLVIAFLSRVMTERQVSNSSAGEARADILAHSGLDVITGDLKQEIVNGSVTPAPTPAPGVWLYYPKSPLNAVPTRDVAVASLTGTLQIPNLIRVSSSVAPPSPAIETALASGSAISTGTSANGRSISLARWNAHYLVPLANASGTNFDTTPISAFSGANVVPSWVMVTNQGPTVLTSPTSTVVGRYAYAIYDEGGLLDMNVAGCPSVVLSSATQAGFKGSEAFADLTQLPAPAALSNQQIDTFLGWRNYATMQMGSGSLSSGSGYTLNSTSGSNYYRYVISATNGFRTINPQPYPSPATVSSRTDQIFTSRQDFLRFARAVWGNLPQYQNALQYMGTFSRDIEQPSFVPNPGRPQVQSSTSSDSATFGTGNDAYGLDRTGTPSTDINPPFLEVRVPPGTTFARVDGSIAQAGDPLVKKRFPLSRLAWITSKGPSADNMSDPVVQQTIAALGGNPSNSSDPIYKYVDMGTAANIKAAFGLTWTSDAVYGGNCWTYNHGNSTGILRLGGNNSVSTHGREADFFELLKAAINVGSLGKGSYYYSNNYNATQQETSGYLQDARDNQTNLHILQIGANIIDQAKADNFPTRIQFAGDPNFPPYEVRGVEDLPYFYHIRNWVMRIGASGSFGVLLFQPELWNPHSPGSSSGVSKTAMPTNFRVRAQTDPTPGTTSAPLTGIQATYSDNTQSADVSSLSSFNTGNWPQPLKFNAGEANTYWGFREPTLLAQIGVPSASNLSGTAFTDYPAYTPNPSRQMTGLYVTTFPYTSGTFVCFKLWAQSNGKNSCLRFYLDYEYPSGSNNWVTYDEQAFQPFDNYTLYMLSSWKVPTTPAQQLMAQQVPTTDFCGGSRTDPRTSRWGIDLTEFFDAIPMVNGTNSDSEYCSVRPDSGLSFGTHIGIRRDNGITGAGNAYSQSISPNNFYRGFQHGYWSENSVRPTWQNLAFESGADPTNGLRYTRDPDGVPRRAMGGYWSDTTNGGTTPSASPTAPYYGLPMATGSSNGNYGSRPTILHRPFRSVAELGYVFSDNPWRNLDFSFPESGDSALLDVFCINEDSDPNGLVAGRVNLNTRQAPVLQSVISGALLDKDDPTNPTLSSTNPTLSSTSVVALASQLTGRTSGAVSLSSGVGPLPLTNRADLVGSWNFTGTPSAAALALANSADPNAYYTGFSADIGTVGGVSGTPVALIPRQRESVIRALADAGTARVWNLMIDLIAQSGRYKPNAQNVGTDFVVEGERRYWLHVAIDRYTGQILDKQLEIVTE